MNQEVVDRFIEHHGVKGMRWGVRTKSKAPRKESADFKRTVPLRNRKAHELTNKQIKTVNERLNLETNYSRLNPSKVQRGHNYVKEIMAVAGTATAVYTFLNSPLGKSLVNKGKKNAYKQLKLFP